MEINHMLDAAYITAICAVIRYLVGADGIKFGWVIVRTVARWAVGK